jgi:hypothetical protein
MNPYTTKILRELEKVSAIGADYNTIFDDWLEITLATLEALPAHLKAARQTGRLAEDSFGSACACATTGPTAGNDSRTPLICFWKVTYPPRTDLKGMIRLG